MADRGPATPGTVSPKEDYNPLADDMHGYDPEDDDDGGDEFPYEHNSFESDISDHMYSQRYCITPPVDSRLNKRQKSKQHSKLQRVHSDDIRGSLERKRNKGRVHTPLVIKAQYGNPVFSTLSGVDSDDNLERDVSRQDKDKWKSKDKEKKIMTTSRAHERLVKRNSDLSNITAHQEMDEVHLPPQTPVEINNKPASSSKQPLSLSCSALAFRQAGINFSSSWGRETMRRQSVANVECPPDRFDFHKVFSALIHMGSHGKRDKDLKSGNTKMDKYKRQKSTEQEQFQERYNDFLWFDIQIELGRFTEDKLKHERSKVQQVLDDILKFKFEFYSDAVDHFPDTSTSGNSRSSLAGQRAILSDPWYSICLNEETTRKQCQAISEVEDLLVKLDCCEQLFPTSKAFAKEFHLYGDKEFQTRVKSLYLWLNLTRDLCHKIKITGKILGVQNLTDVYWPMVDFESPRYKENRNYSLPVLLPQKGIIPDIQENAPGESDNCDSEENKSEVVFENNHLGCKISNRTPSPSNSEKKKVKFTVDSAKSSRTGSPVQFTQLGPSDTSTPVKTPPSPRSPSPQNNSSVNRFWPITASNMSRASSEASLDGYDPGIVTELYKKYVDKTLRRQGMNKMLVRFRELLDRTLQRAREALEQSKFSSDNANVQRCLSSDKSSVMSSSPVLDHLLPHDTSSSSLYSRVVSAEDIEHPHISWCSQFDEMGLPSFKPTYLFLLQVFLEIIHEALKLRLEQRPKTEPSFLSLRPLLRECKDMLRGAVIVKQYYQQMVIVVKHEPDMYDERIPDLESFDNDLKKMLEIYFEYLQNWLHMLQGLPDASLSLKNVLEQEWTFTKQICPHIIGGEAESGKRFSTMASSLLHSIADFLDSGIDEVNTALTEMAAHSDEDDTEEDDVSSSIDKDDGDSEDEQGHENESNDYDRNHLINLRHSYQRTSRKCKSLFNEARERATKALGFAKLLRKDLEIAADFNIAVTTLVLLKGLQNTNHVLVEAPINTGYLMFIPSQIMQDRYLVLQLLNVTCGREDLTFSHTDTGNREEGYLLMVNCEGGSDHVKECPLWEGETIKVEPTTDTVIALSNIQVDGLLLVVINSSQLGNQRKTFEQLMGPRVELVNEQTSCHQAISESLMELKKAAEILQEKVVSVIKEVDEKLSSDEVNNLDESEKHHFINVYRETMLKGYNFGFEYLKEVTRLVTGELRQKLGKRLMMFAREWMNFAVKKCEKGRGVRPKWATHGLEFLMTACEPRVLAGLTEAEFQTLKQEIFNCVKHVIGDHDRPTPVSPTHGSNRQPYYRYPSWPADQAGKVVRSTSNRSVQSEPLTPNSADPNRKRNSSDMVAEVELKDGEDGGIVMEIFQRRRSRASSSDLTHPSNLQQRAEHILNSVQKLDEKREKALQERLVIGRITNRKSAPELRIAARKVNFRWQRGIKIGEGQFGKVYSSVNMDNGELMAMKEIKFRTNDQQALKEIADEITLLEGILHQNIVKYYGVEIHRDEMLVFMEYCDRGTLEEASKIGLSEPNVRLYTKEILLAINHLHEHNIVHRDIKGANIFLTSSGCLKLGDFGCSVKMKSHTTMPGEFMNLVGTMAFMAPEVITKNQRDGYGRAADIWSLGCVVVEMVTGKRPWHEFDNNFQIMFKVGMGGTPAAPDHLSPEGKDFLSHCFEHEPSQRWSAVGLMDHPFVKVEAGDNE